MKRGATLYLILLITGLLIYFWVSNMGSSTNTMYNNSVLEEELKKKNDIDEVRIYQNAEIPTGTVYITFGNGESIKFYTADVKDTQKVLEKAGFPYELNDVKRPGLFQKLLPYIYGTILFLIFLSLSLGRVAGGGAGGGSQLMNFGKSRAKKDLNTGVTFRDVAALEEEKEELSEIVDFLKDPEKYTRIGARIPKGVILEGHPGTGKTLLAKAVSGEAGVPFFSISGSDFVEMFVGVGASRVRDLFEDAKKNAPCIVFIDEIDAVARRRGTGLGGGHDEREQTLNQLLVEMDGFGNNEGIIVMAATNRVDILDPAILRPGRFDRRITVALPDVKGREQILQVHARGKNLGDDVNLHEIARTTSGFAGADLENLMNEAAIHAAKEGRPFIVREDVERSFIKTGIGTEKRSRVVSEHDKRITAYHETGHAILFHLLPDVGPVHIVSIIPTGEGAGGYTMPLPTGEDMYVTRGKMLHNIMTLLGGRIAEELIFDDITTGASHDILVATKRAREMVMKYGFSSTLGLINYETGESDETFLGREIGHEKKISSKVMTEIDEEVKKIIDYCYAEAKKVIQANMDVMHKSANLLLEKDRITGEEFASLFNSDKENPSPASF